jgi:hypothetical protein
MHRRCSPCFTVAGHGPLFQLPVFTEAFALVLLPTLFHHPWLVCCSGWRSFAASQHLWWNNALIFGTALLYSLVVATGTYLHAC